MKRRVFELFGIVSLVAIAAGFFVSPKQAEIEIEPTAKVSIPSQSEAADFHWSTSGTGFEYYFEVRGDKWAALLCSENPMGNYYVQGEVQGERKAQAQDVLRSLLDRRQNGYIPDYGLAYPTPHWSKWRRSGLLGSPIWGSGGYQSSFIDYAELLADDSLVLFFQDIGTNGGYRSDFRLTRILTGGYNFRLSTAELESNFLVEGTATEEDWQTLLAAINRSTEFGKARILTGGGHDASYYSVFFRDKSGPHYYQWYNVSYEENSPDYRLVVALSTWPPYQDALQESRKLMK